MNEQKTPGEQNTGDAVAEHGPPVLLARRLLGSLLWGPALGLLIVLGVFVVILGWKGELGRFLDVPNLQVLVHKSTAPAIVALGMLLIIVSGGIDLSVGSVVALVTVVAMQVYRLLLARTGSPVLASLGAVPAGVAIGGACGLVNGLVITRLRVTPFVATLGMLSIARGLAYWLAERTQISFPGARPGWVDALGRAHADRTIFHVAFWTEWVTQPSVGDLLRAAATVFYPGFWSLVVLALGVAVLLRQTVLGRYCYAIGSNEATARLCGVGVERTKVVLYTTAGVLTGWAGVLLFAQGGSGNPNGWAGLELDVIAAVVIGGASLSGGQGTVLGALLGVLILGILENGVSFCDVPVEVKHILIGAILIANTALSQWQRRWRE